MKIYWGSLIWNCTTRIRNIYLLREYYDGVWRNYYCGKKIWNSFQEDRERIRLQKYIIDQRKDGHNPPKIVLEVWDLENGGKLNINKSKLC